ncbi:glycosyltransferase [Acidimangrovimonas sediminis]|uniref:glycosyltransferase n=1 Tax=Acidimangrovimonas sediminis TaxID=2056283 RepID=UPI000C7FA9B8|nr:glycosyltransferase [Acidimangrovimonas sediminis]
MGGTRPSRLVVLLKGYPRLSETFIAQELLGLERAGFDLALVSLRHPTDKKRHPIHDEIRAPVMYLPEYLHQEPLRVLRAVFAARRRPGLGAAFRAFRADLARDLTRNRVRRFGQALVLAAEWPGGGDWLHAHFIHTPASVARYASLLTGTGWSCSAHAKDIWTSPDWELSEKLGGRVGPADWTVTCTSVGAQQLRRLAGPRADRVHLSYHGLDLCRFAPNPAEPSGRDGSDPGDPVRLLSVGRAVEKKGYDVLLEALARLPAGLHWRLEHIGGGDLLPALQAQAERLGLADRIDWRRAQDQREVLARYRASDLFVLACRIGHDGDRDGLPNVLVEASSQHLACLSTDVSGVVELLDDGETGVVVPPEDPAALAAALTRLIGDPGARARLGAAAEARVRAEFDCHASIDTLAGLFGRPDAEQAA